MTIEKNDKQISRKDFLKGVGKTVAGVTILGGMGGILTACNSPAAVTPDASAVGEAGKPEWPFPYVKLDPAKAEQRAYDAYKTGAG